MGERGHDGRRRHRDKEKGSQTIRKDSASPRTRIHKHASNFLGSMVEEHQRSSYLRRVAPGEDEPLPSQNKKLSRSRSEGGPSPSPQPAQRTTSSSGPATTSSELHALPLSPLQKNEAKERKFSYNFN